MSKKPVLLCIMDGFGKNPDTYGNAIAAAKKPNLDRIFAENPMTYIGASVSMSVCPTDRWATARSATPTSARPRGLSGSGAHQRACAHDKLLEQPECRAMFEYLKASGKALHLMGLFSDGGVHASFDHLLAFIDLARREGIEHVYVHAFMDGRDTDPKSGQGLH